MEPELVADTFVLPPVPLRPCPRCSAETMSRSLCWDCQKAQDAESDARLSAKLAMEVAIAALPAIRADLHGDVIESRVRPADVVARARQALATRDMSYVAFAGPTGAGKTTLAVSMLEAWMRRRASTGLVIRSHDLIGHELDPALSSERGVVLLDDLGSERVVANNMASSLIDARYINARPLWVTLASEDDTKPFDSAERRYGVQCVRRFRDRAIVIRLGERP